MRRAGTTWTIFGTCLLAATTAIAWLSVNTLRAERSERQARQQADLENRVRVALWRMDSIAVPLVAIESTRPTLSKPMKDSPALAAQLVKGYVLREAKGTWRWRRTAETDLIEPLQEHASWISSSDWWRVLPATDARSRELPVALADVAKSGSSAAVHNAGNSPLIILPNGSAANGSTINFGGQFNFNAPANGNSDQRDANANFSAQTAESQSRTQLKQSVFEVANIGQQALQGPPMAQRNLPTTLPPSVASTPGALLPIWVGDELLLARRVSTESKGEESVEACWLNWPEWRRLLEEQITDLLPNATLMSVATSDSTGDRGLVALPVRLDPGPLAAWEHEGPHWPSALLAAWVMLALTSAATAWLLWQTLRLSERRAAFVSAVTHELRTPLTTFRLYTEMLSDGVVQDREQQQTYFQTLFREANRLMHLVENVLAYARLEKGRPTNRTEELSLGELLDRCWPRLQQRAAESPLQLELTVAEPARATRLTTNVMAVEQILFNLIDNACKYACHATDRRLIVSAGSEAQQIRIRIRDFGPGLSSTARRQLFQPFGKSSKQAAETAPGIGLGLTLARRLARELGGDLNCDSIEPVGLIFLVTLPAMSSTDC